MHFAVTSSFKTGSSERFRATRAERNGSRIYIYIYIHVFPLRIKGRINRERRREREREITRVRHREGKW